MWRISLRDKYLIEKTLKRDVRAEIHCFEHIKTKLSLNRGKFAFEQRSTAINWQKHKCQRRKSEKRGESHIRNYE